MIDLLNVTRFDSLEEAPELKQKFMSHGRQSKLEFHLWLENSCFDVW